MFQYNVEIKQQKIYMFLVKDNILANVPLGSLGSVFKGKVWQNNSLRPSEGSNCSVVIEILSLRQKKTLLLSMLGCNIR